MKRNLTKIKSKQQKPTRNQIYAITKTIIAVTALIMACNELMNAISLLLRNVLHTFM